MRKQHSPRGPGPKDARQQAADHIVFCKKSLDSAIRAAQNMGLTVEFFDFPGVTTGLGFGIEVYEEDRLYF